MLRNLFFIVSIASLFLVLVVQFFWPPIWYFLVIVIPYILIGLYDLYFNIHNILRNYPVLGHFRFFFEFVRPEIQQYFINTNQSGRPMNRETRSIVYQRAKNVNDTLPFGTQQDIDSAGYEFAYHSLNPKNVPETASRIIIGNRDCQKPYDASHLNISAMSFGAISSNAILALNKGAKTGHFAHNTGEGGISSYHLEHGGDLIWQIGTGYFGCRSKNAGFDPVEFKRKAAFDSVKMIEIKLSQGAKPSSGGILPAVKVTPEIAKFRGVEPHQDCISPPYHTEFSTPEGLLEFIARIRELSEGKPVGFKLCLGKHSEFMGICKAMLKTKILPDFISIDGAEGGTGAAPIEYSNFLGASINNAIAFVHNCLVGTNLREHIKIIASGKIANGFDLLSKIALGADSCSVARAMMFALGCVQSLRCDKNTCPTGE